MLHVKNEIKRVTWVYRMVPDSLTPSPIFIKVVKIKENESQEIARIYLNPSFFPAI